MGKVVENVAVERHHTIAVTIDNEAEWAEKEALLRDCDVAIDFSQPTTAVANIEKCFDLDVPVVVGTTGWYDRLEEMTARCKAENRALFVASNFSIGMNIMFDLNRRLAHLMNRYEDYAVSITETHHIHKLDAPSGTAISLAKDAIEELDRKEGWTLAGEGVTAAEEAIAITSIREGEVAGIHEVVYDSPIDTITLSHSAKSRRGLAVGAVLAAEFLQGKKGYYTMKELLAE